MKRRGLKWIFAGIIILGVSGPNTVLGQGTEQSPARGLAQTTSPPANPRKKIPAPRVYQPRQDGAVKLASNAGAMASPQIGMVPLAIGTSQLPSGQTPCVRLWSAATSVQYGPAPGAAAPLGGAGRGWLPAGINSEGASARPESAWRNGGAPVGGAPGSAGRSGRRAWPSGPADCGPRAAAEGAFAGCQLARSALRFGQFDTGHDWRSDAPTH